MKRLSLSLAAVLAFGIAAAPLAAPAQTAMSTKTMPACAAGDPVVWVNTSSKVYHAQGTTYFGKTKHGKYACTSAAKAMGAHAAMMKGGAMSGGAMSGGSTSGMSGMSGMSSDDSTKKHHHKKKDAMASPAPAAT